MPSGLRQQVEQGSVPRSEGCCAPVQQKFAANRVESPTPAEGGFHHGSRCAVTLDRTTVHGRHCKIDQRANHPIGVQLSYGDTYSNSSVACDRVEPISFVWDCRAEQRRTYHPDVVTAECLRSTCAPPGGWRDGSAARNADNASGGFASFRQDLFIRDVHRSTPWQSWLDRLRQVGWLISATETIGHVLFMDSIARLIP